MKDSQSGQTMVESAFIMIVLVLLATGIADFAHIYYSYISVVNASNVGATYASALTAFNASAAEAEALTELDTGTCLSANASSTAPADDGQGGQQVSVTVTCRVEHLIGFTPSLREITVTNTAVRRVRR